MFCTGDDVLTFENAVPAGSSLELISGSKVIVEEAVMFGSQN